jgi:hypothetical protein
MNAPTKTHRTRFQYVPYLSVQRPPPNCGLIKQPPQFDGHPVAIPHDVVPQLARSRIGAASRTAFWSIVSHLEGIRCAALGDDVYLDVVGQGDWACGCDGCEQQCGESGELHGDDCWLVGELFVL